MPTFRLAAAEVHAAHAAAFRNDKHRKQWLASLSGAFEHFGARAVDTITTADVLAAIGPLWLKRRETSRRVLQRVRLVFQWSMAQGFVPADPTIGITKVLPKHRGAPQHHPALQYQQVPSFVASLRDADASIVTKLALEFTILCAVRTSETLLARWDEIDLQARTWTIPAGRMKANKKKSVPLSPRCVEILEAARELSGGTMFVFPARSGTAPLSNRCFCVASDVKT